MLRRWKAAWAGGLTAALLLSGCTDQRILEDLGFAHTVSYDAADEKEEDGEHSAGKRLLVTATIPKTLENKMGQETLSTLAATSKDARISLGKKTETIIVSGQLRDALFGSTLAKQGILDILETLIRDPSISNRIKISVVNGNANHLLVKSYPEHPQTGKYIDHMIEKVSVRRSLPEVTLYSFIRDYFEEGIDPIAPMIRETEKDIVLDGMALFRGDKYVSHISAEDSTFFALLRGNFREGDISLDMPYKDKEGRLTMTSIVNHRKIKVVSDDRSHFKVVIDMDLEGSLIEYTSRLQMKDPNVQRELEQQLEQVIAAKAGQMVARLQKDRLDCIGIGKEVRNSMSYKAWKQLDWDETFPSITVDFNIDVKLSNIGMFM